MASHGNRGRGPGTDDLLVVFTDGVTEAANASGEEFGEARLERVLREASGAPVARVCDGVLAAVAAFEGGQPQNDDITLVAARAR